MTEDAYRVDKTVDGEDMILDVLDTAGQVIPSSADSTKSETIVTINLNYNLSNVYRIGRLNFFRKQIPFRCRSLPIVGI